MLEGINGSDVKVSLKRGWGKSARRLKENLQCQVREMVRWLKCLLCKHGVQSVDP